MNRFGSYLAVPLTSGGGLLSGVKLKKHDQELTLGSKVGFLQESGRLGADLEAQPRQRNRRRYQPISVGGGIGSSSCELFH